MVKPSSAANAAVFIDDPTKDVFLIGDEVDLVHGQHDMAYAEQRADQRMTLGLRHYALSSVDQQNGEVRRRRSRRHIPRVLLVAGRIGDNEGTSGRGEKTMGNVDRDALLPLSLEPIQQEGKVDIVCQWRHDVSNPGPGKPAGRHG